MCIKVIYFFYCKVRKKIEQYKIIIQLFYKKYNLRNKERSTLRGAPFAYMQLVVVSAVTAAVAAAMKIRSTVSQIDFLFICLEFWSLTLFLEVTQKSQKLFFDHGFYGFYGFHELCCVAAIFLWFDFPLRAVELNLLLFLCDIIILCDNIISVRSVSSVFVKKEVSQCKARTWEILKSDVRGKKSEFSYCSSGVSSPFPPDTAPHLNIEDWTLKAALRLSFLLPFLRKGLGVGS